MGDEMPKTLLLADDSVVIQKLVGLSFANEDVDLVTTDNGDDAVAKARERKPDVVLADVVMPGMSGYEVCEAIKNDPQLAGTPVLLLTGTFEAFDEARARQAGSDGHITKPFEAQALVDRVNELLTRGRAAPPTATAGGDFFEAGVGSDTSAAGRDVTRAAEPVPSPTQDRAQSPAEEAAAAAPSPDTDGFDFGAETDYGKDSIEGLPPLDDSDLMGGSPAPPDPSDHTVALMPDGSGPVALAQDSPTVTSMAPETDPLAGPMSEMSEEMPDLMEPPAPAAPPPPSSEAWSDRTDDPLSLTPPGGDPFAGVESPAAGGDPALTTVIMSEGNSDSDAVHLGSDSSSVRSLDNEVGGSEASPLGAPQPAAAPPPPADQTILADDLFASSPGITAPQEPAAREVTETSDVFDFGSTDPLAESSGDPTSSPGPAYPSPDPTDTPPPLAGEYDVSQSDLVDPFEVSPAAASPLATDDLLGAPMEPRPAPVLPEYDPASVSDDLLSESAPAVDPAMAGPSEPVSESMPDPAPTAVSTPQVEDTAPGVGPDISPVMRQRIHETLEHVAWEAFADLSETMVKQVLERVESIAWEVIPQMAEALIKEEIRRMKGEDEE
jgi:CheY-like chemotaxis protein